VTENPTPGLEAIVSKLTWRLLPFLFLLYVIAYLDRTNVSFAALEMQTQLGISDRAYGLGAGMFFAGYFFFQLPSNLLLARIGARRWIAALMVLWGIVSCSMILVSGPRSFYLMRFLLGAAEAGFFPGIILYLKSWFPSTARARAISLFMSAAPLSGVIGSPVSGALLDLHEYGMAGWKWLFLLEGIPAIAVGGVVAMLLAESPNVAAWLSQQERTLLIDTLEKERQSTAQSSPDSVKSAFLHPGIWILCAVYFGINTCVYGITLWLPTVIKSLSGLSNLAIGVLAALPNLAAAIALPLNGHHSDRSGERHWHIVISSLVGTGGLLLTAFSGSAAPVVIGTSLAMAGAYAMDGPFWTLPPALMTGTAAAAGIAIINSVGNLGGFFGPYLIGFIRTETGSFSGSMIAIAALLAVTGFLILLVRPAYKPSSSGS
jgi:ACS family tartrate transporter-like MFS transporter